jgi:hypothetical protein
MEYEIGDIVLRTGLNFSNHFLILEREEPNFWDSYTALCLETGKTEVLWPDRSNSLVLYTKVA